MPIKKVFRFTDQEKRTLAFPAFYKETLTGETFEQTLRFAASVLNLIIYGFEFEDNEFIGYSVECSGEEPLYKNPPLSEEKMQVILVNERQAIQKSLDFSCFLN